MKDDEMLDNETIIKNATITYTKWDRERGLTHWIGLEGAGWGCAFGGYNLCGDACYEWLMQIMDVLDTWEIDEKKLIGTNVRARFSGHGGLGSRIEAIGHIIQDKWFCPEEFFDAEREKRR